MVIKLLIFLQKKQLSSAFVHLYFLLQMQNGLNKYQQN